MTIAFVNYRAGRIDEAVAHMERAAAQNPDLILPRLLLIFHNDAEGRSGDARVIAAEIRAINPDLTAAEANRMGASSFEGLEAFRRAGLP